MLMPEDRDATRMSMSLLIAGVLRRDLKLLRVGLRRLRIHGCSRRRWLWVRRWVGDREETWVR